METTIVRCSICCEEKPPVELCTCNEMEDKRICENCAVELHEGCEIMTCNCYGFRCAFCRKIHKTPKKWSDKSVLYWKRRATDLAGRLEECAIEINRREVDVNRLSEHLYSLNRQLMGESGSRHLFMNSNY
jgi:hypothetical protein